MPEVLIETLKEYKEWQDNRRAELGDYMQENDYLFTQENGKRLYPSTFTGWLNKMLREANIDHYSLHSLRHTNITLQIAAGVPIVTVSARAGHARTSTTVNNQYGHTKIKLELKQSFNVQRVRQIQFSPFNLFFAFSNSCNSFENMLY